MISPRGKSGYMADTLIDIYIVGLNLCDSIASSSFEYSSPVFVCF
jgi:hypothetical protein